MDFYGCVGVDCRSDPVRGTLAIVDAWTYFVRLVVWPGLKVPYLTSKTFISTHAKKVFILPKWTALIPSHSYWYQLRV